MQMTQYAGIWRRIVVVLLGMTTFWLSYIFGNKIWFGVPYQEFVFCQHIECFPSLSIAVGKPLFFLSLALLIASPGIFFVSDRVFRAWLRFAIVWFAVAALWVALARTTYHTFNPYSNPTKEDAARIMSTLFVPLSYAVLVVLHRRFSSGRK